MALIEALIAVLIFSFGVLGLIGIEASAIRFSVDAEDRNRAALFASEIASTMWVNGTVTVSGTQMTTWTTAISNTATVGVPSGTLAITPTAGTTNSADIKITWLPNTDQVSTTRSLTTRVILP